MTVALTATAPAQECLDYTPYMRWLGQVDLPGSVLKVVAHGDYAYGLEYSSGLYVVDVSDPTEPAVVGALDLPVYNYDVEVVGDYVYVTKDASGIVVIDVSDPSAPFVTHEFTAAANARWMEIIGNQLYVACADFGIMVVDVADPLAPIIVGTMDTPGRAIDVAVSGALAVVADGTAGIQVVDLSEPASPVIIGNYDTPGLARSVAVSEQVAYVCDHDSGIHAVDLSTPASPFLLDSHAAADLVYEVTLIGTTAVVASGTADLLFFDTNVPQTLDPIGQQPLVGGVVDLSVAGGRAYVACDEDGLQVVELESFSFHPILGTTTLLSTANSIAMGDGFAFVAGSVPDYMFEVVDVSDRTNPVVVSEYGDQVGMTTDLALDGDRLYVANWFDGLSVLDVSSPHSPQLLGAVIPLPYANSVAVVGEYAYVGESFPLEGPGFSIVDIDGPGDPRVVGQIAHAGGWINDIVVIDDTAYLCDGSLQVIDVSLVHSPIQIMTLSIPGPVMSMCVDRNLAFVASSDLVIVDLTDAHHPVVVAQQTLPGPGSDVWIDSGTAYVTCGDAGTAVVDVTNPLYPSMIGQIWTGQNAQVVAMAGAEIFIAGVELGVVTRHCDGTVGITPGDDPPPDDPVPAIDALVGVQPNPFNPGTEVSFSTGRAGTAVLAVFDPRGRLVRRLHDGYLPVGPHRVFWDGRDDRGRAVSAGVYFVRLETATSVRVQKAALVK